MLCLHSTLKMNPDFDITTQVIGIPCIITSALGLVVAGYFVYKISLCPYQLEYQQDDSVRKAMSDKIVKLGVVISNGAYIFFIKEYTYLAICAAFLFVLVSAAVDWRTGLW